MPNITGAHITNARSLSCCCCIFLSAQRKPKTCHVFLPGRALWLNISMHSEMHRELSKGATRLASCTSLDRSDSVIFQCISVMFLEQFQVYFSSSGRHVCGSVCFFVYAEDCSENGKSSFELIICLRTCAPRAAWNLFKRRPASARDLFFC